MITFTDISCVTSSPPNSVVSRTFSCVVPVSSGTTGNLADVVLSPWTVKQLGVVSTPLPPVVHSSREGLMIRTQH